MQVPHEWVIVPAFRFLLRSDAFLSSLLMPWARSKTEQTHWVFHSLARTLRNKQWHDKGMLGFCETYYFRWIRIYLRSWKYLFNFYIQSQIPPLKFNHFPKITKSLSTNSSSRLRKSSGAKTCKWVWQQLMFKSNSLYKLVRTWTCIQIPFWWLWHFQNGCILL